jgi:NADPH-dependent 2,4-dienoyl-CoA reductase/sulfur reductase-like enzyme
LRNKQDYLNIYEALSKAPNKNVTIIGGGFIGMELASAIKLAYKDANVTVL